MQDQINQRISTIRELFLNPESFPISELEALAKEVLHAFKSERKIAFVGNGGSAAEAMHLAAEFTGKCVVPHTPLPALCLNESQSALTAIANDYGVEEMFSRQVDAHLISGDILIALSTSGSSINILRALSKGVEKGVRCHLWTGDVEIRMKGVNYWRVPSNSTPRIQEIHLAWGHILAELVELEL